MDALFPTVDALFLTVDALFLTVDASFLTVGGGKWRLEGARFPHCAVSGVVILLSVCKTAMFRCTVCAADLVAGVKRSLL
ncbi:MAG: hypothetical protein LBU17_08615 [Treponema sp.]|nr:hypothetical protein [Treponema sp.]